MNGFEKNIAAITGRTSSTEVYEISQQMYAYGLRFSELSAASFKQWAKRCERELIAAAIIA
jgi:hypothetical protein